MINGLETVALFGCGTEIADLYSNSLRREIGNEWQEGDPSLCTKLALSHGAWLNLREETKTQMSPYITALSLTEATQIDWGQLQRFQQLKYLSIQFSPTVSLLFTFYIAKSLITLTLRLTLTLP